MTGAHAYLEDIEQLAHEKSSTKRRELLNAVTDLFLVTLDNQEESDVDVFGDVMDRIAFELEVEARVQLSQKLCNIDKSPHKLVVKLANDVISVAKPVLERSTILRDSDLIQIIGNRSQDHLYSIAGRLTVSQQVSGALVDKGSDTVVTRLTGNHGAELSHDSLTQIAERAVENSDLLSVLGLRGDLPGGLMDRIKSTVAERMKSKMSTADSDVDPDLIDTIVGRCAEDIDLEMCEETINEFAQLRQSGKLTEDTVAKLARAGRLPDAVHCLSLLTGMDDRLVSHCVLKAEIPALAILCKANRFKSTTFLALAEPRLEAGALKSSALAKAMRDYNGLTTENAERIFRFLKVRLKLQQNNTEPAGSPGS